MVAKTKDCLTFVWGRLRQPPEMSHRRRCQSHVSWPKRGIWDLARSGGCDGINPSYTRSRSTNTRPPQGGNVARRNATNLLHLPHRRVAAACGQRKHLMPTRCQIAENSASPTPKKSQLIGKTKSNTHTPTNQATNQENKIHKKRQNQPMCLA